MATSTFEPAAQHSTTTLLLVWQHPETRLFSKVGRLSSTQEGYRFEYLAGARNPNFEPLQSFPDIDRVYHTRQLPVFFQNRVMSRKRRSFEDYSRWLGLDPTLDLPFEILARTGGGRATDTFHVVEEPHLEPGSRASILFFASGLSHVNDAMGKLLTLRPGDRLSLRQDASNPVNEQALLIDATGGEELGWVPDWLLDDIHRLTKSSAYDLVAERVNLDAPWHLKLMCRFEAQCP